ncbi:exodeoxyribonuclease VII small subunit [Timonella sp. A28]|uniref:exodeoxyribonuclease VII small subunit n=1 Tax=Timonella sp. A28 TaxID=3442640 RepID=UPI003EBFE50F
MAAKSHTQSTLSDEEKTEIAELGYEAARDQLIAVVQQLEAGSQSLESSLALWERGELLAQRCQEWLDGARQRLDEVRAATTTSDTM